MSWSLILVLSNREKGIKMWHFSTLVTGKSTAALLLLWKWRVLAPFKCKFLFEGSCTAVPSGALTIYCLFLYQNTSQTLWTVGHQNHFNFKVIHIRICRCAQVTAVAAVIHALPYRNTLQLAVMAMLMLSLLLASLFGFLQSSSVWGKWKKDEAFFWTFSCSGICFIFTSNEAPPTFFFFFLHEVTENSGWLLPDKRHVFVWHWVGGLHHLAVRLMAMRSSVPTQRQRAKTIIRGN